MRIAIAGKTQSRPKNALPGSPGLVIVNYLFFRFPRVHIAVRAGSQIMVEGTRVFTTVLSVVSLIDGNCLKTGDRQEGWSIMKDLVADEFEILLYTK